MLRHNSVPCMLKTSILTTVVGLTAVFKALASDVYNPATNQLRIQSVMVSDSTYSDVVITVGKVVSIAGGQPKGTVDTYNALLNQLTVPSVQVNNSTYTNVIITVDRVITVGDASVDGDFASVLVTATMPN